MVKDKSVSGLTCSDPIEPVWPCEACLHGKMTRSIFSACDERARKPGELLHLDLVGPMTNQSMSGANFLSVFVDDLTGMLFVNAIRHKSEIVEELKSVVAIVDASNHKMKRLRSDNAKEFISHEMKRLLGNFGIVPEHSAPYCPEQNGRVERQNRTIVEMARTMMIAGSLPISLWAELCRTAAYLRNRISLPRLNGKTPFEMWTGVKPDVGHLRTIGCRAFSHIPDGHRKKFDSKSEELVLVGYESGSNSFRLWKRGTKDVKISHNVKFIESDAPPVSISELKEKEPLESNRNDATDVQGDLVSADSPSDDDDDCIAQRTRSKVGVAQPTNHLLAETIGLPDTYNDAILSTDAVFWRQAMKEEMISQQQNNT